MAFPTKFSNRKAQAGVTLLLSVLVLAAITAIAFSLAAIVSIEIRAGADFLRTEPALYAVQSVTEEAIFNYKRNPPSFTYLTSLNGVTLTTPLVIATAGSPTTQVIAANNGYQKYQLVNPSNLYDSAHYGKIRITYASGNGAVSVLLTEADPGSCGSSSSFNASLTVSGESWSQVLNGCLQYELKLTNAGSQPAQVSIASFADDSATNPPDGTSKGLPYIGSTVLEITAKYLGLSRKYQVTIPGQ